jgi:hypothetical protein
MKEKYVFHLFFGEDFRFLLFPIHAHNFSRQISYLIQEKLFAANTK